MSYVNTVSAAAPPPFLHLASGGVSSFTLTFWVKCTSYSSANSVAVYALNGPFSSATDGVGLEGPTGTSYLKAGNVKGGAEGNLVQGGPSYQGWQFCAIVVSSGSFTTYSATESSPPSFVSSGSFSGPMTDYYLATPFTPATNAGGKYYGLKAWNSALSTDEILAEFRSRTPVRTSNLFTFLSGDSGTVFGQDQSGNGNSWSVVSPTVDVGEDSIAGAISAPSNTTIALANAYTLPSPASLSSFNANITVVGTAGNQLNVGLYTDVSGVPGVLLASTGPFTPVVGWNSFPISLHQLPAGTYWVAVLSTGDGTLQISGYVTGAYSITPQDPGGAFPATWNEVGTGTFHSANYAQFNVGFTVDADFDIISISPNVPSPPPLFGFNF